MWPSVFMFNQPSNVAKAMPLHRENNRMSPKPLQPPSKLGTYKHRTSFGGRKSSTGDLTSICAYLEPFSGHMSRAFVYPNFTAFISSILQLLGEFWEQNWISPVCLCCAGLGFSGAESCDQQGSGGI